MQTKEIKFNAKRGMKPGQILVNTAVQQKAKMIVVGSRGVGAIRRTLLGTVSDYVIHNVDIPVVIVPVKK